MNDFSERAVNRQRQERLTALLAETTRLNIEQAAIINRQAEFIGELVTEQAAERMPPGSERGANVRVIGRAAS